MIELFYVFDLGDALAAPLERLFAPLFARAVAQLVSFGINAVVWAGFAVLIVKAIDLAG